MSIPFAIVDAFCLPGQDFSGNPAAVCLLTHDDDITDETKARIGAEFNLSETSFVSTSWNKSIAQRSDKDFTLRWFTPEGEIALCGHATLASAKFLFSKMKNDCNDKETTIYFETKFKGSLCATMHWDSGRISINLPLTPVKEMTGNDLEFVKYLVEPFDVSIVHSAYYVPSTKYLFIRLNDRCGEKGLIDIKPNYHRLCDVKGENPVIGAIVSVKGSGDIHFYSRFFAPWLGVNEDPVCGSAHCALMSYWPTELKSNKLLAKQCSKRGGRLHCSIREGSPDRVYLEGNTKVFSHGELLL
ncbi:phenazine biosynthesis-like domain-containing protein [Bradysia coprophila]|uniref:phenazine biosynthesis-like domain-containing protein n=1 Tax=Bradysia coprophila TaxID=38358 RepID=UPI00187DC104|nr:phenazine biosynthesis-like domain-containing protein [Bradysia coprophila]